jgi:hypothetical protein
MLGAATQAQGAVYHALACLAAEPADAPACPQCLNDPANQAVLLAGSSR